LTGEPQSCSISGFKEFGEGVGEGGKGASQTRILCYRPLASPKILRFSHYPFRLLNWRTWYMKASRRVRVWVCSWPS
jgi:hypothetical protein